MPRSLTDPEFLKYFQIPGESIYVLGCFATHVTVYSQQVRALNLVTALRRQHILDENTRVGIIGGGAAGLMAASASASWGATVKLVDKMRGPMGLQRNSRHRWLHPTIYDWPKHDKDGVARLPFFPWKADFADIVVRQIERLWDNYIIQYRPRLKAH